MASLEMHHCMLNIFDIAIMITENALNTVGFITEFQLVKLIKQEHINNRVPVVMLCKSCHQKYHHKAGMTGEIMEKIIRYLNRGLGEKFQYRLEDRDRLLALRDNINILAGTGGLLLDGHSNPYEMEEFANDVDPPDTI